MAKTKRARKTGGSQVTSLTSQVTVQRPRSLINVSDCGDIPRPAGLCGTHVSLLHRYHLPLHAETNLNSETPLAPRIPHKALLTRTMIYIPKEQLWIPHI